MRHAAAGSMLTFCLAVLSAGPAFTQTPSSESGSAATASAAVAYVYVGTGKGAYLYDAAANGTLTPVSGSPFKTTGLVIGSSGKYFITLGTDYIHSYAVASNGAIKAQVSQINTKTYFSNPATNCGATAGGILDHTGQDVYVLRGLNGCTALQSFEISSAGALSFLDSSSFDSGYTDPYVTPPTIIANDVHAYNGLYIGSCAEQTNAFQRLSNGALQFYAVADDNLGSAFTMNFPAAQPGFGYQALPTMTADPFNNLAVALQQSEGCGSPYVPVQLASYTAYAVGSLVTANTMQNMPTPNVYPTVMNISPSGDFLAVGGNPTPQTTGPTGSQTAGLQVFYFNGISPITTDSGTLTTAPINEIHWDNSNHLYALSNSTGKLYVYTVTSAGITAVAGSPYTLSTPNALVVVPTITSVSCIAPSSVGVNICSPVEGSTVSSPVLVKAAATVTGTVVSTQLWVDGVKKFNAAGSTTLTTSVSLAAGSHRFAVIAVNTSGQKWESAVNAAVN
jgi:hypothetical protein